jgi:hypothetical protein
MRRQFLGDDLRRAAVGQADPGAIDRRACSSETRSAHTKHMMGADSTRATSPRVGSSQKIMMPRAGLEPAPPD